MARIIWDHDQPDRSVTVKNRLRTKTAKLLTFANLNAIENNPIQRVLYSVAYPLALGARALGLSPNQLTAVSFALGILSFVALALQNGLLFSVLFAASHLLDYVDGTLARMTGNKSSFPISVDHFSDMLKLNLIFIGFGLYFRSTTIWLLASLAMFSFLYYTLLNHAIASLDLMAKLTEDQSPNPSGVGRSKPQERVTAFSKRSFGFSERSKVLVKQIVITFGTINGHTMLVFFLIPVSIELGAVGLAYLVLLAVANTVRLFEKIRKGQRPAVARK